ncbi:MAG: DNA alkylation repair protein [Chloroflexi bacterium]|nr:DNA alkylation repair protein [Chloroflexota bacterium]
MPAVELGRLQQQVVQLSDLFQQPANYLRGIEDLLRNHEVPVHRQGRVKGMRPVLASYEVPPPLLKQLQLELSLQAKQYPAEAIKIADGLWARPNLETRLLAIYLLGSVPTDVPTEITNRLASWAQENREQFLVPQLASSGTKTLRTHNQSELLEFAAILMASKDSRRQILALGVLRNLLFDNQFSNLPKLFDLLAEPCKDPDRKIRPELADLLIAVARLSSKETEFFLQQILAETPSEGARWLARQVFKALPDESRERLRSLIK